MKPRIYIETTIIGYLAAHPSRDLITAAHQQVTLEWWENRLPDFDIFISQLVIEEASAGDEQAKQRRLAIVDNIPLLEMDEAAVKLARSLIESEVIPEKAVGDALHIAIATLNGMDYLLTWNLAHLANATIRNNIALVCRTQGYEPPVICTPEELLEG
jgi:hypothetical protein